MTRPAQPRSARVRAFAKINLDLRVLYRRPDEFHELRTIFQTISLADELGISFAPAPRTQISVNSSVDIPGNLIVRAAERCLDAMRISAKLDFHLDKRIPMGSGLGGGSSDAAAVLLALPVLAGRRLPMEELLRMAADLGSDVPFFLIGGTAAGGGRGTELYPLPDLPARPGVVVAPGVHISTAEAYRRLSPRLTMESQQNKMVSFQSAVWTVSRAVAGSGDPAAGVNDFETVVFEQYPQLKALKQRLLKLGARPAMMSGSGSAIYGLFPERAKAGRAVEQMRLERVFPITTVSRIRYRARWRERLREYTNENLWPPQSRYAR
jgi:4-diphosphocytidyl-2-C-methyl-D-erythritol kinase